nr:hypothetical protein [Tanacetum cinerariifolium]
MGKSEFGGMTKKDIMDMTIAEYMKYEEEIKNYSRRSARSYFSIRYEHTDIDSFHHDKSRVLDYLHYSDDAKIDAYYDLPPLLPCFKHVQPYFDYWCKSPYESLEEDTNYIPKDESFDVEQGMNDHTYGNTPFTPNPQYEDGELSSEDDLNDWLKTKMKKHMCGHEEENEEDALIVVLKIASWRMQGDDIQDEDGILLGVLPCWLPPKELSPGSFTLPCTIGNIYAMADLGASVNVMP